MKPKQETFRSFRAFCRRFFPESKIVVVVKPKPPETIEERAARIVNGRIFH